MGLTVYIIDGVNGLYYLLLENISVLYFAAFLFNQQSIS